MATGISARFYEASSRLLKQCFKGSKSSFFTEIYWEQLFWDASWSDSNLLEVSNLPVNWTWQCKIMNFSTTLGDSLIFLPFKVGIFNWPRRPYISSRHDSMAAGAESLQFQCCYQFLRAAGAMATRHQFIHAARFCCTWCLLEISSCEFLPPNWKAPDLGDPEMNRFGGSVLGYLWLGEKDQFIFFATSEKMAWWSSPYIDLSHVCLVFPGSSRMWSPSVPSSVPVKRRSIGNWRSVSWPPWKLPSSSHQWWATLQPWAPARGRSTGTTPRRCSMPWDAARCSPTPSVSVPS